MPLSSGNFADLLKPGLKRIFDIGMGRPSPMIETLFGVESSTRFEEQYQGMGALGTVPVFDGTVAYHDFDAGYRVDIRNYEFAMGIQVERRLVDDDQYGQIRRRASNMADAFNVTREQDAVNVFINAFTDSGTNRMGASTNGADGVALCSTAHPYSPANSGTTQSNEATLALNLDNLDTARQAMRNFTDDKGMLLGVNPDTLLVPPELERTAMQIVSERAIYEPNSAEYTTNMFSGRFRPIVWDRLTDSNSWFLIDSTLMKQHLIWQNRITPEFSQADDFDGLTAKFRGYMRYGIGWTDWKWVYGSNPS
jgi:phage major head subunit gpT-like protein